jgi:hypothetical protein
MNPCESLRQFYLSKFQEDPHKWLPVLCTLDLSRKMFLNKYASLTPIEDFPEEEKIEWKKFVHELFPDKPVEFKLEAVKIIYVIGILTNE